ncbi:MAG TPA: tetratricopeptide repeat protein [Gammaproteobacteria bacterium]|nr:tetratricopeptide repeat protein [Gammaproteobacteria bacterium]
MEPLSGKVSRPGGDLHLPLKAMETLLCLAEHPRFLVSHDELLRSVWGDESGGHEKLSHAIGEIRKALDDHPAHPRFVRTIPRRGYCLLVEPVPAASAAAPAAENLKREPQPARALGFYGELKRRGVIDTALGYLVLGWVLIQVADVTFDQLTLPPWAATFVTYLVIVGFPIALMLAWFVELTPKGAVIDIDPDARPERAPLSKTYKAILGALALASLGVFVYDRYVGLPGAALQAADFSLEPQIVVDPNSIAVLPFLNIGDGDEGRIFSEGLADDVINRLTRVPGLRVSSRGDSFSLPPNSASQDVRRRLRVAYYLEGSVRVLGDTLRVVVQLIDSATGFHIVSRSFDRELEDFFSVQDEVTRLTVANLRVALPPAMEAPIEIASDNANIDAYVLYRLGMEELYKPATRETIDAALEAFMRSLSLDPDYAAAHAGMCLTYAAGYRVANDAAYIDAAERSCATALSLNANLDVVHNALGELYSETGRYDAAEAAFERALAINESSVASLIGLGDVYHRQQRLADAESKLNQAIGLQPGNWDAYNALGGFLFGSGRYEEAALQYREVVSLDARNMNGWNNLGACLTLAGRFAEAAVAYERSIRIQPVQQAYSNVGILHYYLGEIDEAVAALERAVELAPNDYINWSNLGDVLSYSATPERAVEAFMRAEELAERRLQVNIRDADTIVGLAWIKAMLDKFEDAAQLAHGALEAAPGNPHVHYINALILMRIGDRAAALETLETAVEMGYPRAMIAAEPHLTDLRSESRFQELIRVESH